MSAAVMGGGGAAATGVAGADAGSGLPCSASRHMCSATLNSPCTRTEILTSVPVVPASACAAGLFALQATYQAAITVRATIRRDFCAGVEGHWERQVRVGVPTGETIAL